MLPLPDTSGNRIKLERSGYIKAAIGGIIIFGLIILYVREFDHFDKTLNSSYLMLLSLIIGVSSGILLGKKFADKEDELFEQMRIYMTSVIMVTAFMPLMLSLVNQHLDFRTPQKQEAYILEVLAKTNQPFGHMKDEELKITHYEFTILLNKEVFHFSTENVPFPDNQPGDIIEMPVYQGLLGIKYLKF